MAGTLYLCATPIGNLEDMTFRAVRILREVDLIAAEDTRNSIRLLNHFEIHTPMTSYHEHNKYEKAAVLVQKLLEGNDIACITDAGTPGISDPGEVLTRMCVENGIRVTPVPGACACIAGLVMSGQETARFCFEAFLPQDRKERAERLEELQDETRTIVLYEAPHHLRRTLDDLLTALGDREMSICRELTKKHEEGRRTTLAEAAAWYREKEARGEYVLVIAGKQRKELREEERRSWGELTLDEHMKLYESQGMDKKTAMKQVARDRGLGKREIYQALARQGDA